MRTGLVQPGRPAPETSPETFQRRRRVLAFGAIALAILIVIIIAVVASGGGGGSPTAVPTTPTVTQPVTPSPTTTPSTTPTTTSTQPSTPSLRVAIPSGGNLSAGDSGDQVLTLQKALKELGEDVGTPDGKFGQKTQDAVKAFQTAHGLTPDGVVGKDTADAINNALATSAG